MGFKESFERITPILIKSAGTHSIKVSLSKRFFLFDFMKKIMNVIEEDPHLNFISLLKSYKTLGNFLHGTLHEFYRDRNKAYFKNFFYDKELYKLVRDDLKSLYPEYKDMNLTITKRGVIIYDNYKKNTFNVLLLTIHSGTWVPKKIQKKLHISPEKRYIEEDINTDKIYRDLVLKNGGIWIDNKQSRYVIDFNRSLQYAIYKDEGDPWVNLGKVWDEPLSKREIKEINKTHTDFYFTLQKLLDTYRFNIIFDGHSMKSLKGRPEMSFGIEYTPKFYYPIIHGMRKKLKQAGYDSVKINDPYGGGFILDLLNSRFPDVFTFSMEVNKSTYMTKDMKKIIKRKYDQLIKDISGILDIEVEEFGFS